MTAPERPEARAPTRPGLAFYITAAVPPNEVWVGDEQTSAALATIVNVACHTVGLPPMPARAPSVRSTTNEVEDLPHSAAPLPAVGELRVSVWDVWKRTRQAGALDAIQQAMYEDEEEHLVVLTRLRAALAAAFATDSAEGR